MTVIDKFFRTIPTRPLLQDRPEYLAGRLIAACEERGEGFSGEIHGWRVRVGKVIAHREMVEADLWR